uniref:Transmembrane protein 119 n=1 Tax=Taeniopygia guttata TaxID=59729 RepID=H0Z999_TAEGU
MKGLISAPQTFHSPSAGQCCDPTAAAVPVGSQESWGSGAPPTSAAAFLHWINGNQIVQPGESLGAKSCCWSPSRSVKLLAWVCLGGKREVGWDLRSLRLGSCHGGVPADVPGLMFPETSPRGRAPGRARWRYVALMSLGNISRRCGGSHVPLPNPPVTPRVSPTVGDAPGTTVTNSSAPGVLDGLVDFFKEYLLLVVVVGSLSFVLLFIICAAVIVRQKHKASAYYPSSFPKKKYVDERDKSGGARAFSEVPEKGPEAGVEEPLDAGWQLQADILAAAQNLKSPHKAPLANGAQGEQNSPQEEEKEEEEEGKKKLGDEQAKPPAQNPGVEEAASAGSKEMPDASQDGCQAPSGI